MLSRMLLRLLVVSSSLVFVACSSSSSDAGTVDASDDAGSEAASCGPYRVNCAPADAGGDAVGCPGDAFGGPGSYPIGCTYDTVFNDGPPGSCTVDHQWTCEDGGVWMLTGI